MFGSSEWNQDDEILRREAELVKLKNTEGWVKLTNVQRRMIEIFLYVQVRAERTTDIASSSAITSPKTHGSHVKDVFIEEESVLRRKHLVSGYPDPYERKYRSSQNFITDSSCHMAIASLESGLIVRGEKFDAPKDFFVARYEIDKSIEKLSERIEKFGFPCVVHIMGDSSLDAVHSFLVMGHDDNKKIVVWEKKNFYMQYHVVSLEDVFMRYDGNEYSYGIRELRTEHSEN